MLPLHHSRDFTESIAFSQYIRHFLALQLNLFNCIDLHPFLPRSGGKWGSRKRTDSKGVFDFRSLACSVKCNEGHIDSTGSASRRKRSDAIKWGGVRRCEFGKQLVAGPSGWSQPPIRSIRNASIASLHARRRQRRTWIAPWTRSI